MDGYDNYDGEMVTMYQETGGRQRDHEFAPSYENLSQSRSPRRKDRFLSPQDLDSDPYYRQDYENGYHEGRSSQYRQKAYRDKDDSRLSSRDRRRSRSRDRDRSRDRSRDRRERRDNSRDRYDSRDRYYREADRMDNYYIDRIRRRSKDEHIRREDDRYDAMPPSPTIIIQNLTANATEQMIRDELSIHGLVAKRIALIRERNGENRGYGFAEFYDINTAEKWLKLTKRNIIIDGRPALLNFSKPKRPEVTCRSNSIPDWYCLECKSLNFGSRKKLEKKAVCFNCGVSEKDSEQRAYEENYLENKANTAVVKLEPCNVLMVRGMDFSTTEESIRLAMSSLTSNPIYDVRLIKDKVTDMSRGFAFIELGTTEDAKLLLETIENSNPPFEIESRRIAVGFARHGYNAPLNGKKSRSGLVTSQTAASNAVAQASAAKATAEYSQSMADSYTLADTSNQHAAGSDKHSYYQQNAPQAVSSYTYDPTSGYYYDSSTGLYYDANSGYYYNGTTGQFLYWNGSRYQAVNQDGTPVVPAETAQDSQQDLKKSDAAETDKVNVAGQKPKEARKIAKDMARWAKKMNNANEARKVAVKQAQEELKVLEEKEEELRKKISQEKSIVGVLNQQAKEGIRSMFVPDNDEEGSILKLGSALAPAVPQKPRAKSLVADFPDDDDDDDVIDESKLIDVEKLACLLCKRQFPSNDVLMKHLQMSELHKQNLQKCKKSI